MGGASTLFAPGLEALFTQPASLVGMDGWELGSCVQRPTGGAEISLSSFALGRGSDNRRSLIHQRTRVSSRAYAIAFQHLRATLADGSGWGEMTLAAAAAWSPRPWLSAGIRVSSASGGSDDDLDRGRAVSISAGVRAVVLHPAVEFGWVADDIHHSFSYDGGIERRRAASQQFSFGIDLPRSLGVELLSRLRSGAIERYSVGAEIWGLSDHLALRGGMVNWRIAESVWSGAFGAGIKAGALSVDYGFLWSGEEGPGAEHRLSLLWKRNSGERVEP